MLVEDVDMDSPRRPEHSTKARKDGSESSSRGDIPRAGSVLTGEPKSKTAARVEDDILHSTGKHDEVSADKEEKNEENRVFAMGGVKREMNKRSRKKQQRQEVRTVPRVRDYQS